MKSPITFAIAGFGSRGSTYASMAELFPEKIKIVAVADIVPEKVEKAKKLYASTSKEYTDAEKAYTKDDKALIEKWGIDFEANTRGKNRSRRTPRPTLDDGQHIYPHRPCRKY